LNKCEKVKKNGMAPTETSSLQALCHGEFSRDLPDGPANVIDGENLPLLMPVVVPNLVASYDKWFRRTLRGQETQTQILLLYTPE